MEIYQLKYFEATARTGSIGAAAKACEVAQPTLSVQIKALEEELGIQLFERHARGVKLTRAGERVLRTAQHLVGELDQLRHDIDRRHFGQQPTLRIGIQPFLATEVLAASLRKFMADMSGWRVTLRERTNDLLIELLLSRQADLCLMGKPARWPLGLVARQLFTLPFAVYCRTDHPLAKRGRLSMGEVLPFPLLIWNDPSDTSGRLNQLARKLSVSLHVVFTSDQAATAFTMAAKGAGVAVLPAIFAQRCQQTRMKQITLSDSRLTTTVCAVWRSDSPKPEGLEELMTLVKGNAAIVGRLTPT